MQKLSNDELLEQYTTAVAQWTIAINANLHRKEKSWQKKSETLKCEILKRMEHKA